MCINYSDCRCLLYSYLILNEVNLTSKDEDEFNEIVWTRKELIIYFGHQFLVHIFGASFTVLLEASIDWSSKAVCFLPFNRYWNIYLIKINWICVNYTCPFDSIIVLFLLLPSLYWINIMQYTFKIPVRQV